MRDPAPTPSDFEVLLRRLRQAGLQVGLTETLRLQRVLNLEPVLDVPGLERLLVGVVAKSTDDADETRRVLGTWRREAEDWLDARQDGGKTRPVWRVDKASPPSRFTLAPEKKARPGGWPFKVRWQALVVALVLAGLEVALFLVLSKPGAPIAISTQPELVAEAGDPAGPGEPPGLPQLGQEAKTVLTQHPEPPTFPPSGPAVVGLGVALALGGTLWRRYRSRSWLPPAAPLPQREGPWRVRLRPPPGTEPPRLLLREEQDSLVWGIERFVAEEPGERLDVGASVAATARSAGRPVLEFERARHHREVWLWCDDAADDPVVPRLAKELTATLEAVGLVVERADFWGVPHRLVARGGVAMAPSELDERRDSAIVAILTDGRILVHELESAERQARSNALLRDLARWPRLAFVDFSRGDLAPRLAPRGLSTVVPSETFAFLGGVPRPARHRSEAASGDVLAWLAACALPWQEVDEVSAHALRRHLGLDVSGWELQKLASGTKSSWARLTLPLEERAKLLSWLLSAESTEDGRISDTSLFGRALDFWEERYQEEEEARRAADDEAPWIGTPAEAQLRFEAALLQMWRHPVEAAEELYRLFQAGLADDVRRALASFAPADGELPREPDLASEALTLPWAAADLPPRAQVMFHEMGLGRRWHLALPQRLRRPGRLWLAVGLCAGLALGGLPVILGWVHGEPTPGKLRVNPKDGYQLVYVPAGWYTLGADEKLGELLAQEGLPDEWVEALKPVHSVRLSGFWMGKVPVTNAQYRRFLEAEPDWREPGYIGDDGFNEDAQPVLGVNWCDAMTYCSWAGLDLPTEAQWEAAARGTDQRHYPWGDDPPTAEHAHFDQDFDTGRPSPVGSYPRGEGPFGALDQAGNVWEWTRDAWDPSAYQDRNRKLNPLTELVEGREPCVNQPEGDDGSFADGLSAVRVLRGGSWDNPAGDLVSTNRNRNWSSNRNQYIGFRCVSSVPAEP